MEVLSLSTMSRYVNGNVEKTLFWSKGRQRRSWLCRSGSPDLGSPFCRLRAHRLAALRGVRAHVRSVRSARQNGCGLPSAQGRLDEPFGKDRILNIPSHCEPDRVYGIYSPCEVNYSTSPIVNFNMRAQTPLLLKPEPFCILMRSLVGSKKVETLPSLAPPYKGRGRRESYF